MLDKVKNYFKLLANPERLIWVLLGKPFPGYLIPDKVAVSIFYWLRFRKFINLNKPQSFNEKLLWLSLYDRKDIYTRMADKYEAKSFINETLSKFYQIGKQRNITPTTLQICNSFDEINFQNLPAKYVIKTTHDSGSVVLVSEDRPLNLNLAKKVIEESLNNNYYWYSREWVYKNIKPRVIVEEFIETSTLFPVDYKFYCFNGIPRMCAVISSRDSSPKMDFVDLDYERLPYTQRYKNSDIMPIKPECWDEMIKYSTVLSKGVPFLRVDYFSNNKGDCLIGELTFYPSSGLIPFDNPQHDNEIGEWLKL